ncbi:mitochondrial carrier domain-containing protein [Naematelia encephala]|uniref:Mitochondrial carrier domain-containing protein n=1 Tax=Naematelia encephala TaxID=71784 RepID=A0A1Y2AP48_9TREE|nr:mitochondrial carrier domain-containing protein [Naematelia encephala]
MPSIQIPFSRSSSSSQSNSASTSSASPIVAVSSSHRSSGQHSAIVSEPLSPSIPEGIEIEEEEDFSPIYRGRIRSFIMDNQLVINTFIAGGLAGAASRTVVSPLERLKIILQVQASGGGQAYGGVWRSLARMWREEGFRGYMKGNGINVIRILPYSALQFTSYGGFKSLLASWSGETTLSTPLRLAAGAGAGMVAVAATYPLDLVRARLSIATANMAMANSPSSKSAFSAQDAKLGIAGMTKKVYMTEGGIRGLYRGCWATAVGVAPYVSLNFYIYESLRSYILPAPNEIHQLGSGELTIRKLFCGALAGASSLIFTHPFDVLRRKLQVAGLSTNGPQYGGAIDAMRQIIRKEGFWKGMYRGLTPNLIKVTPSIAVSFYTFEAVRDLLARWEDIEEAQEI